MGALPSEITVMNTLTVNLHLLMVSFYTKKRKSFVRKSILLINTCFKVKLISMDTKQTTRRLNVVREHNIRTEDVLAKIK
jgi:kynureninase